MAQSRDQKSSWMIASSPAAGRAHSGCPSLFVDEEQIKCSHAVLDGRAGVSPGGLEAGVPEKLGDDDEVGAAAHEGRCEGVPEDVGGGVVVEAGRRRDARDDVVGTPDAEAPATLVKEQCRT